MNTVIKDIEAIGLAAPPAEPFGYAQQWVNQRTATLVRVEASDGTVGWGECWGPVAGTHETVTDFLSSTLKGEDPLAVERLYEDMVADARAAYQSTVPWPAISGLDIALWDLAGKLLDQPVAAMLGGYRRTAIRVYATGHYFKHEADLNEQYKLITAEAEQNAISFGAVKAKIGLQLLGYGYKEDIELIRRIREAIGQNVALMVDANYAYDAATAREVGRALEELDVRWFEEPVHPENIAGYAHLREALDVPITGGECHAPYEFDQLFNAGGLDVAQPDVCNVGGLTAANRVADRARIANIPVVPHVWGTPIALAASLQLIATLPGAPWLEFDTSSNPLREDLAVDPIRADNGTVSIPNGPGLGVDLDRDAIEQYRIE